MWQYPFPYYYGNPVFHNLSSKVIQCGNIHWNWVHDLSKAFKSFKFTLKKILCYIINTDQIWIMSPFKFVLFLRHVYNLEFKKFIETFDLLRRPDMLFLFYFPHILNLAYKQCLFVLFAVHTMQLCERADTLPLWRKFVIDFMFAP